MKFASGSAFGRKPEIGAYMKIAQISRDLTAVGIAFAAIVASPAQAASLLTTSAGYAGPILDLSEYNNGYTFTAGPVTLPNGITYSSSTSSSVIGNGDYGLSGNGQTSAIGIIGTNSPTDVITLLFANPVNSFGARFNYAPGAGDDPTISAFDINGGLIAAYDLATDAPISTPDALNAFAFRGIGGGGTAIASFQLSGSFVVAAAPDVSSTPAVPEPATWVMMLVGFGFIGFAMRKRFNVRTTVSYA